jgi:peroxiredoxin
MRPRWLRQRALLALLLAAAAAAVLAVWWRPPVGPATAPAEVPLAFLDGRQTSLGAWRGQRIVLLDFWSLTCRPCLEERAALAEFYQRWQPHGLAMVAVAMPYDPPLAVREFEAKNPSPYPIALDVQGELARAFRVETIPLAVLLAPDGRILYRQAGRLDRARLEHLIGPLLSAGES